MTAVAADVAGCFAGLPRVGDLDQAFLFLTTGTAGKVDTCLLSRMELRVTNDGFAAVVASRRARANLAERPVATIIAVHGDELHTFSCEVSARLDAEDAAAFGLAVRSHQRDGLGIELTPMRYRVAEKLPVAENWDRTERLLRRLATTGPATTATPAEPR
jgi:hypothetical protein